MWMGHSELIVRGMADKSGNRKVALLRSHISSTPPKFIGHPHIG